MVKAVDPLTLRATEGFAPSLCRRLKGDVPVPDSTTVCRRAKTLTVALPTTATGPIPAVLNSTGLNIFGEGEGKVRQHSSSQRRTWRKLHLSVDEATGEIQAEELTAAGVDDAEMAEALLEQTSVQVKQLSADGAYDKEKVYRAARRRGVAILTIPPRRDARIWQHGNRAAWPHPPDVNLRRLREVGRKQWKAESGYHRRSLAETARFRFKTIFGDRLRAQELARQKTETRITCAAPGRLTQLGKLESYRVA